MPARASPFPACFSSLLILTASQYFQPLLPHAALTPEIVQIDQSGQNRSLNTYPSRQNTVSNGIGNRLPLVLGGVALLLGMIGTAIGIKRRKWFKSSP
jgi:hypothetical protein